MIAKVLHRFNISYTAVSRSAFCPPFGRPASCVFPMVLRSGGPASCVFLMVLLPASPPQRLCLQHLPDSSLPQCRHPLRHGAPASNKPHQAEKSTPVWLAIWRIWAGFANSQHRDAAFATPDNICAHSSLLPHWAAAQTDANLSAHLHRLPTPPPYLRRMRLSPGRRGGVGWQIMLLVVRSTVPANHRARFKNVNYL